MGQRITLKADKIGALSRPQIDELGKISPGIMFKQPMSSYTYLSVGGPADALVIPNDISELRNLILFARDEGLPLTAIGDGANLIVTDAGIRGLTLRLQGTLDEIEIRDRFIEVGCGTALTKLVRTASKDGLQGLEFATGIPGTLGGAVAMNAGTHLGDMSSVVETVTAIDQDGIIEKVEAKNASFAYRSCGLVADGGIVLGASMSLKKSDPSIVKNTMEELLARRKETQPVNLPCAGCIFKNPSAETPAGKLIDSFSLKDTSVGGAVVSSLHANFIVNVGGATASDVLELIGRVRDKVKTESGINMELEVKVIGN